MGVRIITSVAICSMFFVACGGSTDSSVQERRQAHKRLGMLETDRGTKDRVLATLPLVNEDLAAASARFNPQNIDLEPAPPEKLPTLSDDAIPAYEAYAFASPRDLGLSVEVRNEMERQQELPTHMMAEVFAVIAELQNQPAARQVRSRLIWEEPTFRKRALLTAQEASSACERELPSCANLEELAFGLWTDYIRRAILVSRSPLLP